MAVAGPRRYPNPEVVLYVGGLDENISETLLRDSFSDCGFVVRVHIPKDRKMQISKNYGFIEYMKKKDADKAILIKDESKLMGRTIHVNRAYKQYESFDIGANLFIGNLDPAIHEKILYNTFSTFGVMMKPPTCIRNPITGVSKGFAFIHYSTFEAADEAIKSMDKALLGRRNIVVSYSFKKGTKEPHGTQSERDLATRIASCEILSPKSPFTTSISSIELIDGADPQSPALVNDSFINSEDPPGKKINNELQVITNNDYYQQMPNNYQVPLVPYMSMYSLPHLPQANDGCLYCCQNYQNNFPYGCYAIQPYYPYVPHNYLPTTHTPE